MKKLALIILALVVALGSLGVSYALWNTRTLTPTDNIYTGTFACQFQQAVSNDGTGLSDPTNAGSWTWTSGSLTASNWSGNARSTNKASTAVTGAPGQTLTINMNATYVGYWSSVGCTIKNTGNVPLKINTVTATVTPPSGGSVSDVTVSFSDALLASSHTQINAGSEALGAIYVVWNHVPSASSTYTLTVTINTIQFNN